MARIYTRTGDRGETSLLGGIRVAKSDPRVDLYGGVDECNSALGLAIAVAAREARAPGPAAVAALLARLAELLDRLTGLQAQLFDVGAILADPGRSERLAREGAPPLTAATRLSRRSSTNWRPICRRCGSSSCRAAARRRPPATWRGPAPAGWSGGRWPPSPRGWRCRPRRSSS